MPAAPRSVRTTGLLLTAGLISAVGFAAAATATAAPATGASNAAKPVAARATPTSKPTLAPDFTLCSGGTYGSYAVFEKRGNLSTTVVPPGQCIHLDLTGQSNEKVTLFGLRPNGQSFKIATDTFDDADGERVRTLGTPDHDDWTTF
ncbi:hypothetical protein AB0D10_12860 [Kitasatospora sp. NPDC048545]|uniref:hypothetical protein n=1 Tax=Kitasatospora sp. NPDC048545 TaxID=3157208 RepID=UPI0033EF6EC4